jgi:hypothetical protein
MANMLILGAADLFTRGAPLLRRVEINQAMVGVLAIALTALAAAAVLSADSFAVAGVGWAPIVIAAAYVFGVRLIHTTRSAVSGETDDAAVCWCSMPSTVAGRCWRRPNRACWSARSSRSC